MRPLILVALFSLLPICTAEAHGQRLACNRSSHVIDQAGKLSPQAERDINAAIREHEVSTTDEVILMTIPELPAGTQLEPHALRLFKTIGIGRSDANNGVLILLTMKERSIRIATGLGIEPRLTDEQCAIILATAKPKFAESIDAGLGAVTAMVLRHLREHP